MFSGLFLSCLELSCFHSVHTPCPDVGPLAWHVTILRTWNDVSSLADGVVTHTLQKHWYSIEVLERSWKGWHIVWPGGSTTFKHVEVVFEHAGWHGMGCHRSLISLCTLGSTCLPWLTVAVSYTQGWKVGQIVEALYHALTHRTCRKRKREIERKKKVKDWSERFASFRKVPFKHSCMRPRDLSERCRNQIEPFQKDCPARVCTCVLDVRSGLWSRCNHLGERSWRDPGILYKSCSNRQRSCALCTVLAGFLRAGKPNLVNDCLVLYRDLA